MHKITSLLLFLIATLPYCQDGCAADNESQRKLALAVDAAIRPIMLEHNIPGLAVAVTRNGEHTFANYGVASKETGQPITRDTIFEIGSISKTFTATLATQAQLSGKISMSDAASKYLPSLGGSSFDQISLLDLATYAAGGLPLQFPDNVKNHDEMVAYFKNWKPTFAAGTHRLYSNPSIGLFGLLTANSMGQPFNVLMEKNVLATLGLTHTYLNVPNEQMKRYAQGYTKADKPIRVSPGALDAEAYGVKSSAADMIRFIDANMKGVTLAEPTQNAITATHVGYFKVGNMTQALGWEWYQWPITLDDLQAGNAPQMLYQANAVTRLIPPLAPQDNVLINKTGSTNGFGAYVAYVPGRRLGIVILANKNYPIAARVKAALEILMAADG